MSLAVYDDGLRTGTGLLTRRRDGSLVPLDVTRWHGPARGADETLLSRVTGSTLDIGCGPGRLVAALTARGVPALGIDVAPAAVGLTRRAGGRALQLSVFDQVPGAGTWRSAVLADGNIGIGGDPSRLLTRVAELLHPDGVVLLELGPPQSGLRVEQVRLEDSAGRAGTWFRWAHVPADVLDAVARPLGFRVVEEWSAPDPPVGDETRWFATLARG